MRSLEEVLKDLNDAEKEYAEKCKKYGIEEKQKKKKIEVPVDENGNPIQQDSNEVNGEEESATDVSNNLEQSTENEEVKS